MLTQSKIIPALLCMLTGSGLVVAQQTQPVNGTALTDAPTAPAPQVAEHEDGIATSTSAAPGTLTAVSQVRIVRLSQVMGKVQMARSLKAGYEPTFANLPVIEGAKLKTFDGLAEVEFEDNSSLRIAPDSELAISRLGRDAAGNTSNGFSLAQGTLYLSLANTRGSEFVIQSGGETFTLAPASHIRLDVYPAGSELKVFKGSIDVKDPTGSYQLAKGKVFKFGGPGQPAPLIARNDEPGLYDSWDKQSVDYHSVRINAQSFGGSSYQYGLNDLNYYGSFSNLPGCGNAWQPYFTSANWNPYGSGMWAFYPGAGYSFVSPYPWGWAPYHSGNWVSCGGAGWGWQPGTGNSWRGLNNVAANTLVGGTAISKPGGPHPIGHLPGLIPVGAADLHRSQLNASQKLEVARDSAGLGIPRAGVGNLGKLSQQVSVHGTAQTSMRGSAMVIESRSSTMSTAGHAAAPGRALAGASPNNTRIPGAAAGPTTATLSARPSAPASRPVAMPSGGNGGGYHAGNQAGGMRGSMSSSSNGGQSSHMSTGAGSGQSSAASAPAGGTHK